MGLLVQCAILLYTTYAGKVNTVAALVVLIVAEVIPGAILAVTMRQPTTQKSVVKDLIWCFLPPDGAPALVTHATVPCTHILHSLDGLVDDQLQVYLLGRRELRARCLIGRLIGRLVWGRLHRRRPLSLLMSCIVRVYGGDTNKVPCDVG